MNTLIDDDSQMEYLRQYNLKKKQQIERRKEKRRVLLEKMKYLLKSRVR